MRAFALALLTTLVLAPAARADARLRAGGGVGILFRDEAGANRSVLPALAPELSYRLTNRLVALAEYTFAYAPSQSDIANVTTQHHRLSFALEVEIPVRRAVFVGGLGPAAVLMHTTIAEKQTIKASTTIVRPAVWGFVGLEIPFASFALRTDVQVIAELDRVDYLPTVGVLVPFGSGR